MLPAESRLLRQLKISFRVESDVRQLQLQVGRTRNEWSVEHSTSDYVCFHWTLKEAGRSVIMSRRQEPCGHHEHL